MADDIRKQLGPNGLSLHKPVVSGPGGIPISSGRRGVHAGIGSSSHNLRSPARSGSKDGDLQSSMIKRLQQLEALNQSLKSELKEKNEQVWQLKEQNQLLSKAASADSYSQIAKISQERDKYKQEVEEMRKFLSDYGLKWVGGDGGQREGEFDAKAINEELKFQAPQYRSNLPKEIDTEILTRRIEELNFIAEKQRIETCRQGMKAFKMLDDVPIFFFANGLMIKGFPFYPYYSKQAQCILSDILEGYFPYDLKKEYPEGVPLKPVDYCDETYNN
jgi:UBX domain-containing protein 11